MRRFAETIEVGSSVIGDIIGQRKNKPSFDVTTKILRAFPQIRAEWLLRGEGEMLNSAESPNNLSLHSPPSAASIAKAFDFGALGDILAAANPYGRDEATKPSEPTEQDGKLRVLTVQVAPDGDENIEMVPVWAAAGYAAGGFIQPTFISKLPHFRLPGAAYRNGSFRCFEVHGSSMEGTLKDGDWLICRYVEKWAHDILDNRVYVIVTEQDILVKRVLNQINERGMLSLHSDNPTFDVQFMDWHDVREVWQGVARLTRDLTNTRLDVPVELARQQASIAELFERLGRLESNKNPNGEE